MRLEQDGAGTSGSRLFDRLDGPWQQMLRQKALYHAFLLSLLAVSVGLYVVRFDSFQVGTYMDDAQYIVLAKSLVEGDDYGLINPPEEVLPTRYAFGWPLILAPAYAVLDDFRALRVVSLLFTVCNTVLVAMGWRYLGFPNLSLGLAAAVFYALSPMVVGHARMVMSEPAFLFFALLCLILTPRLASASGLQPLASAGLGAVWMFGAYVRTIGLTLVMVSVLYLVLKKKWTQVFVAFVGFGAALLLVTAFTAIDGRDIVNSREYLAQFRNPAEWGQENVPTEMIPRIGQGLSDYTVRHLRDSLVPFLGGPTTSDVLQQFGVGFLQPAGSVLVLTLVVTGYVCSARNQGFLPAHLFVPAYVAVTVLWPWRGVRILYGIYPFLFAYLLLGGSAWLGWLARRVRNERMVSLVCAFGLVGAALLLAAQVARSVMIDDSLDHVHDLSIGTAWIREHAAPDALVVAEQPQAVYLYSERATVGLPSKVSTLRDLVPDGPVYVLITPALKWSDDGQLEYSQRTQEFLRSWRLAGSPGKLVFEVETAMVQVYLLDEGACPWREGNRVVESLSSGLGWPRIA